MGFDVIDRIANAFNLNFKADTNGLVAKGKINGKDIILLKPTTYMNLSGNAILPLKKFYKLQDKKIIVIYDDKDTLPGNIRIRKNGSAGGHNGIKSVLNVSKDFIRVRVGIGLPKYSGDMINHVISKVKSDDEYDLLQEGVKKAEKAIYEILKTTVDIAMNKFNNSREPKGYKKESKKDNKKVKEIKKEKKMNTVYITGHKNPDTDAVMSAIVLEDLYTKLGKNVKAIVQGKPSKETQFALDYIGLEIPEIKTTLPEGTHVMLTDHNYSEESLENISELHIDEVIDHHAVKLVVGYPLYYRAEPVGCTCTILFKMYKENNVEVTEKMAKAMLSAIISDTLLFKSPTCTKEDIMIGEELAKIAGINKEEYGLNLLKAGTDLSDYTVKERLNIDAKTAEFNGFKATVAQITTADINESLKELDMYRDGINAEINENGLDLFMLLVTDIINSDSQVIALGNKQNVVEEAYNVKLENDNAFLKGVVSRKKQVIPVITEVFNKQ